MTQGNVTIFSQQVCASPPSEPRNVRSATNFCDSVRKLSFIIVPRKFPGALILLSCDGDTCAANDQMSLHVNEYLQHKTAVIKKDMVFI